MGRYEWLLYVALAGLAWGTYVPIIFYGGNELSAKPGPSGRFMAILCVGIAYFVMDAAISHQQERNKILQTEIATLDKQIKEIQELQKVKANLLARMRVIEQLQQSRSATVHFFD